MSAQRAVLVLACWVGSVYLLWTVAMFVRADPPAAQTGSVAATAGQPAAKPTTLTATCANDKCHAGILTHRVMHAPTAQQKCLACHSVDVLDQHKFKPANRPEKLCLDCHTIKTKDVVHKPVLEGKCTQCHNPHGSDFPRILVADLARGLCMKCHQKDAFAKKMFLHAPASAGACILCHEAHSAWQPKLLIEPPGKLCLTCHASTLPKPQQVRYLHEPVRDNCTACHDSHASDIKHQLRQQTPDLCLTCHKKLKDSLAASPIVHGAVTQPGGCAGCHAPHASWLPHLEKQPQPQSCLSCHDRPLKTAAGQPLTDMAALLRDNPQHHGPVREGDCSACHRSHAGTEFRLLRAGYPQEFYSPFQIEQYKLCFTCHLPEMVLLDKGVGLTRFRDGEKNLHWLHVNQAKGRTCRACHEVHASRRPFHIRETVPFGAGGWMLEINYKQTATGGTCLPGCHKERSYDHQGADRIPVAPPALEVKK